jgi:hypothetical protein
MALFWKKKKAEENIDEEIKDIDLDLSSDIPPPPPAPAFVRQRIEEHPEDLFTETSPEFHPPEEESFEPPMPNIEEQGDKEIDKLFDEMPLPAEAEKEEIKKAVEEVKQRPEPQPKPTRVYLRPEVITMEDIEREFAEPVIEEPRPEDFGFIPKPTPEQKPIFKPAPKRPDFELPEFKDEQLPDFESVFSKTPEEEKVFTHYVPSKTEGELFIRLDDYSKISPKIKELQTTLNSTVRVLNEEANMENSQLNMLGALNNTLDQIQETLMEIDGLVFKEKE